MDIARLKQALANTQATLQSHRNTAGYWEGQLSSSALSTATAITALALFAQQTQNPSSTNSLIDAGRQWLLQHQNPDGGWGDTDLSLSNISTTALVWAALGIAPSPDSQIACQQAEFYLTQHAGSIAPQPLARAITQRYGRDHTFSVPILSVCALAGRLGNPAEAWQLVPTLPFELAALPQGLFRFLGLPVVSYALPALIALGQLKHAQRPTRNPLWRWLRNRTRQTTLNRLAAIQPTTGGYLEATPLTSFVLISLLALHLVDHPVVIKGIEFLRASVRPDGSWPIDTHLATWVTTLAINAQEQLPPSPTDPQAPEKLKAFLLNQQHREPHPYTGAAPGGWAWTPLSGGVPDADDTAGALLALRKLGEVDTPTAQAATLGLSWLIKLQNNDGGIPTFCHGWGTMAFDRSSPDITAHALRAALAWADLTPPPHDRKLRRFCGSCMTYLAAQQQANGSWLPLWFGNQYDPAEVNAIYGTSRVLRALEEAMAWASEDPGLQRLHKGGIQWLIKQQHPNGSWGGLTAEQGSIEETALALDALANTLHEHTQKTGPALRGAVNNGVTWLLNQTCEGASFRPAPLGFYFAKLWYYEQLYPIILTSSALNRVWRISSDTASGN